ncbi:hypothetical protein WBJ53_20745 [Spirosoma sp. SC4-14]|uniref:SMP-30/gluconolactonase/LRE family protein n=1 Tax=Spirosoma sp. SC4-14 TaxID=3128900 RepID=UPI0030CB68FB
MLTVPYLASFLLIFMLATPMWAQPQKPDSHRSAVAFQLPEAGLITEGVAYDTKSATFFVGSVHERKISQYNRRSGARTLSQPGDSLWGIFGLKVDEQRRLLWACSSALLQAKGVTTTQDGQTELVAYDLKTNQLLGHYPILKDGKPHLLGDLTTAKNGTVYATDSRTPWLYRLVPGKPTVEPFLTDSLFYSLQGLALSDDEQTLYLADYRQGPLAINLSTQHTARLSWPEGTILNGIDGLYYYQNSLIGIQNRTPPFRIIRMYLSQSHKAIERVETLETNHPLMGEPTLGVIAGNQFYYIANSQWDAFDRAGRPVPGYTARQPMILVLKLN